MSWHVELKGDENLRDFAKVLMVWDDYDHLVFVDADIIADPVLNIEYGKALMKFGQEYLEYIKSGVRWNSMDGFNDEFSDMPAWNLASMCYSGRHIMKATRERAKLHTVGLCLNPLDLYYGIEEDGKVVTMANDDCLKAWLEEQIDFDKFVNWLCRLKLRR